jgi:hypothetical protein
VAARAAQETKQRQIEEAALEARLAEDAHQKQLAAEEARQAERDRVAQLERQRLADQLRAKRDAEARERASAESKAEARQQAEQQRVERKVALAQTEPATLPGRPAPAPSLAPPPHAALEIPVVRGPTKDISLVGFRQTAGGSRVFVRASDVVHYSVTAGGSHRIILEVENARISQHNGPGRWTPASSTVRSPSSLRARTAGRTR